MHFICRANYARHYKIYDTWSRARNNCSQHIHTHPCQFGIEIRRWHTIAMVYVKGYLMQAAYRYLVQNVAAVNFHVETSLFANSFHCTWSLSELFQLFRVIKCNRSRKRLRPLFLSRIRQFSLHAQKSPSHAHRVVWIFENWILPKHSSKVFI